MDCFRIPRAPLLSWTSLEPPEDARAPDRRAFLDDVLPVDDNVEIRHGRDLEPKLRAGGLCELLFLLNQLGPVRLILQSL